MRYGDKTAESSDVSEIQKIKLKRRDSPNLRQAQLKGNNLFR